MRTLKMIMMSGMLLAAIACSKEDEVAPDQPVPGVQSGDNNNWETTPLKGRYLIGRFEQDGVENPELRLQEIEFYKEQRVAVRGRNYEFTGTWQYDEVKKLLNISVPGDQMQAKAVSAAGWEVISKNDSTITIQANNSDSWKKMELLIQKDLAGM